MSRRNHRWRVAGESVRGAAHVRAGRENQDALCCLPQSGEGSTVIVAIADGHGSEKCFRSSAGARLAVEAATDALQAFVAGQRHDCNLSGIKHAAEERLPPAIVRAWRMKVDEQMKTQPLLTEELECLPAPGRHLLETQPRIAYGTTLLCVAVTERFILSLQLGDGDIVMVSEGGRAYRPMPADSRLFANETTSLASDTAIADFRVHFQVLHGAPPAMVLMSTDGYGNSYKDDEACLAAGKDILDQARTDGMGIIKERLPEWLSTTSRLGSGDDVTLAVIKREEERDVDALLSRLSRCELNFAKLAQQLAAARAVEATARFNDQKERENLRTSLSWARCLSCVALAVAGISLFASGGYATRTKPTAAQEASDAEFRSEYRKYDRR